MSALTAEGANINGDTFAGTMLGSTDAIAAASSVYFGTVGILTDLHHKTNTERKKKCIEKVIHVDF